MYKHILLATDLTEASQKTAQAAMNLAKDFGAKLSVVHVVEPIPSYSYGYIGTADIEAELAKEAEKNMAKLAQVLSIPEADQRLETGQPKAHILEVAKELGVDLIVVGSHGRHGLARLLGSTASAVLHGAECDVLTIRYDE